MGGADIVGNVLYYTSLPVVKLSYVLYYIVYTPLSPFIYLARAILFTVSLPIRLLIKLEPLLYFFGFAILIGLISAAICYAIVYAVSHFLKLDRPRAPPDVPATGHDPRSYRKHYEKKRVKAEVEQIELEEKARKLAASPLLKQALAGLSQDGDQWKGRSNLGSRIAISPRLQDSTILEHSDESNSS